MSLKENLKKFREQRGYLNGKDFASAIGIPYPRYMTYERGSWPNEEILIRIAALLRLSVDELLGYQVPSEDTFSEAKNFLEISTAESEQPIKVGITATGNVIISLSNDTDTAAVLPFKTKEEFIQYVQMLRNAFTDSKSYHETLSAFVIQKIREMRSQKILARYFSLDGSVWNKDTDDLILSLEKHAAKKHK